jgi:hypothetical protein
VFAVIDCSNVNSQNNLGENRATLLAAAMNTPKSLEVLAMYKEEAPVSEDVQM